MAVAVGRLWGQLQPRPRTPVAVWRAAGTCEMAGNMLIFNEMVEYQSGRLDRIYAALADANRRRMLQRLARGALTIGELAAPLPMSLAAASKHVQILERAGLVHRERVGREHHISLVEQPLTEAAQWALKTVAFWERRLDQLEHYLNEGSKR